MIKIKGVAKRFRVKNKSDLSEQEKSDPRMRDGYFHSVENGGFQCEKGEVLGLLGTNGAGKTTTLRVLATALKPDKGDVFVDDIDVVTETKAARSKIGFLSGSTGLYRRLTGRENIEYFGQLHGMSASRIKERVNFLADMLDMHSYLDRRSDHYSTGMKQKVSIARAVVHEPSVVILDEPTTGLDVLASTVVLNFISGLKENGVSVIFSTHHLDEVKVLCDNVVVMHQGHTCYSDTVDRFQALGQNNMHDAFLRAIGG